MDSRHPIDIPMKEGHLIPTSLISTPHNNGRVGPFGCGLELVATALNA